MSVIARADECQDARVALSANEKVVTDAMGVKAAADIDNLMADYRTAESKRNMACKAGDDVQTRSFLSRVESMKKVTQACTYVQAFSLPKGRKEPGITFGDQTAVCVGALEQFGSSLSEPLAKCLADCRAARSKYLPPSADCSSALSKENKALDEIAAAVRGAKPGPGVMVDFNASIEKFTRSTDASLQACDASESGLITRRVLGLSAEANAIATYAAAQEANTKAAGAPSYTAVDKFKACRGAGLSVANPDPRYAGYVKDCTTWQDKMAAAEKGANAPKGKGKK
jgi:hypothetical protein